MLDRVRQIFRRNDFLSVRSLFVLSTGRTGTQSLTHLLNLSPEITAFHEPEPLLLEESLAAYPTLQSNPEALQAVFLNGRRRLLQDATHRGRIYAEMSNRMTYFAPVIAQLLPNARFLHLYRHPADVVRSGMRRGWYDHHKLDRYRITPTAGDPAAAEWADWDPFSKICWYWSAVNDFATRFSNQISPDRFLAVRFEDLFADNSVAEKLFTFTGVQVPPEDKISSVLSVRHNEQRNGDFPSAGGFNEQQRQTLSKIAGGTIEQLGYTLD